VISFLSVGHTHEDIDQLFSRIAVALMDIMLGGCCSIGDFKTLIEKCTFPNPVVTIVKEIINITVCIEVESMGWWL
jgi:hypothetical protein